MSFFIYCQLKKYYNLYRMAEISWWNVSASVSHSCVTGHPVQSCVCHFIFLFISCFQSIRTDFVLRGDPKFPNWSHLQAWGCVQDRRAGVGRVTLEHPCPASDCCCCCCSAWFCLALRMLPAHQLWSSRTSASPNTKTRQEGPWWGQG